MKEANARSFRFLETVEMQTVESAAARCVLAKAAAGEPLLPLGKIKILSGFDPATRWRWALSQKIPAVKLGSRYLTTESAVCEWLARVPEKPEPRKTRRAREVDQAMEAFTQA